jgi:hypothetical protein
MRSPSRNSLDEASLPVALPVGGAEQLNRVARWILEQDLLAPRTGDDVVSERHAFGAQTLDLGLDVVHHELDTVPAPRARLLPVRHRPPRGAGRPAQQQAQVATEHVGEGRRRVRPTVKPKCFV